MAMHKSLIILFFCCFIIACKTKFNVTDYNAFFDLKAENVDSTDLNKENGAFIFYDGNMSEDKTPFMIGKYIDGFRDGLWQYQYTIDSTRMVTWAHYKDKDLDVETNIFAEVDSILHGDGYSIFKFKTDREQVKLTIALNSEIIKRIRDNNDSYLQLLQEGAQKMDSRIISYNMLNIGNTKDVGAYKIIVQKGKSNKLLYLYVMYVILHDGTTFDFAVQTSVDNSFYAKILFDGIISNTYLKNERIYNPWANSNFESVIP